MSRASPTMRSPRTGPKAPESRPLARLSPSTYYWTERDVTPVTGADGQPRQLGVFIEDATIDRHQPVPHDAAVAAYADHSLEEAVPSPTR
jgi:hypothetical protein